MRFTVAVFLALFLLPGAAQAWCGGPEVWPYFAAGLYEEGSVLPQNFSKAAELYETASKLGSKEARCKLARLYEQGKGVPQDNKEAYFWALAGGESCLNVIDDVAQNIKDEDVAALNKRAQIFHSVPSSSRTISCGHTVLSTPERFPQDIKDSTAAAAQGKVDYQIHSALLYSLVFDDQEAYFWYSIAATSGNSNYPYVVLWRDKAAQKLTPKQIAAVDKRVQEWKPVTAPLGSALP